MNNSTFNAICFEYKFIKQDIYITLENAAT